MPKYATEEEARRKIDDPTWLWFAVALDGETRIQIEAATLATGRHPIDILAHLINRAVANGAARDYIDEVL